MNQTLLKYFTGTGNAKNTAFWIADKLERNSHILLLYMAARIVIFGEISRLFF